MAFYALSRKDIVNHKKDIVNHKKDIVRVGDRCAARVSERVKGIKSYPLAFLRRSGGKTIGPPRGAN